MFIKEFDYLSPKITLYYKGLSSHSSIFSGLLSLISIIIISFSGVYFSLDFIRKKNPISYYLNRFVEDAGEFPLNSSSLFHFISLGNTSNVTIYEEFDFRAFRIIGYNYLHGDFIDKNIEKYDHWLYGLCNNESDTIGIGHLINEKKFKSCACIRKYYNSLEHKYYDTNEKEFKWPTIAHGNINPNSKDYQLIVDKCEEKTLNLIFGENYHCKNDIEISEYLSGNWGFTLYFIDHYIDLCNYKEPNKKFFFRIENTLFKDNFSINNLNFSPTLITTNDGIFFDNIKNELSYAFDRNDAFVSQSDSTNNNVYMVYYFWLKNRIFSYERIYKRVQDIISDIGGISEFVSFLATILNYFYSEYIVLSDTEEHLFSSIKEKELITQKNNIDRNIISNREFQNIKNVQQNYESTKSLTDLRIKLDKTKLNNLQLYHKMKNNTKPLSNLNYNNSRELINIQKIISNKRYEKQVEIKSKNIDENKNKIITYFKMDKIKSNFFIYLLYKITCIKIKNNFNICNNFRIKIISEEYFIKTYLNVFNLLKLNENQLNDFKNKYQLVDLITLV